MWSTEYIYTAYVDEAVSGPTIEWGFVADLHGNPALALVDELFIEMHFSWLPGTCSNPRAACADLRSLCTAPVGLASRTQWSTVQAYFVCSRTCVRRCGVAVHAWPCTRGRNSARNML